MDGVPTLVLANKQDCDGAMAVEDIKQMFNQLIVGKLNVSEGAVLPISALRGCAGPLLPGSLYELSLTRAHACRDGIREAVDWLFLRVHQCVSSLPRPTRQLGDLTWSSDLCAGCSSRQVSHF